MNKNDSVVIVGGGLAGANAAFALREHGMQGRVVLVGEELVAPYERPPLSKGYLRGEDPFEKALVRPEADYETQNIELLHGRRAITLDPATRTLNLDDGADLTYDSLLLTTGSKPRKLGFGSPDLAGVHYLRKVEDADALRESAGTAKTFVGIGGGCIVIVVAAILSQFVDVVATLL